LDNRGRHRLDGNKGERPVMSYETKWQEFYRSILAFIGFVLLLIGMTLWCIAAWVWKTFYTRRV